MLHILHKLTSEKKKTNTFAREFFVETHYDKSAVLHGYAVPRDEITAFLCLCKRAAMSTL